MNEPPGKCDSWVPAAMETGKPRPWRYAPGWGCATYRSWRWRIMKLLVSMRRRALRSQIAPMPPSWSERTKLGVLPAPKQWHLQLHDDGGVAPSCSIILASFFVKWVSGKQFTARPAAAPPCLFLFLFLLLPPLRPP
ncbi:hypothetical protein B296_00049487 [Ensete ventricosum]|uniref:Uncharacterized protein n=1 Tax=Ensete ventricosum TaxID=4639 RepID=A0A426YQF8_ENSVE|nr:hypothetical protein B296_00049487 [Ensete ventricosum]